MFIATAIEEEGKSQLNQIEVDCESGLVETHMYQVHKNEYNHQTTIEAVAKLACRNDNSSH